MAWFDIVGGIGKGLVGAAEARRAGEEQAMRKKELLFREQQAQRLQEADEREQGLDYLTSLIDSENPPSYDPSDLQQKAALTYFKGALRRGPSNTLILADTPLTRGLRQKSAEAAQQTAKTELQTKIYTLIDQKQWYQIPEATRREMVLRAGLPLALAFTAEEELVQKAKEAEILTPAWMRLLSSNAIAGANFDLRQNSAWEAYVQKNPYLKMLSLKVSSPNPNPADIKEFARQKQQYLEQLQSSDFPLNVPGVGPITRKPY